MSNWIHASCEAMYRDERAATAPLNEFLEEYDNDDNVWWMIGSGHHLNLFEAAVEARDTLLAAAEAVVKEWTVRGDGGCSRREMDALITAVREVRK